MNPLHVWLAAEKGRASWLAKELGRSKTAISLWKADGVPLPLIPTVARLTRGKVTEESMLRHTMNAQLQRRKSLEEKAAA